MRTATTLRPISHDFGEILQIDAYHNVRLPVIPSSWKIGVSPGMTVGIGATDEVEVGKGNGRFV
jgi:hypothetical protein